MSKGKQFFHRKGPQVEDQHQEVTANLDVTKIYDYYTQELLPALIASFPILLYRISQDGFSLMQNFTAGAKDFLAPNWNSAALQLWEKQQERQQLATDFLLQRLDTNGDGHISASELVNFEDLLYKMSREKQTLMGWISREWPLLDWKLGVFVWRSFGGILLTLAVLSIMPGRLHKLSGKILRWPILVMTYILIVVELFVYVVIRLFIRLAETLVAKPKHRMLRRKMANATNYEDWYEHAAALDLSQKRDKWQKDCQDSTGYRYNWALISQLMQDMRQARERQDVLLALAVLRQCTRKNVGGIMSEDLFSYTNTGEPKLIVSQFISLVEETLHWITDEALSTPDQSQKEVDRIKYAKSLDRKVRNEKDKIWKSVVSWATLSFHEEPTLQKSLSRDDSVKSLLQSNFHRQQLIEFLKSARHAYGRTALCLSGGAAMGCYHFGHLKGLMETNCLPHIISGTSAGSAIGALVCTRTNEELERDLKPEVIESKMAYFKRSWPERIKSAFQNGHMFDNEEWHSMVRWFANDLTFEEAYKKTGRIYCITLASTTKKAPPVLINYISAPNVTIASAVVASAAVPGFIEPVRLQIKEPDGTIRSAGNETYFDGSIEHDIPIAGLSEMLNCQFFIACQCNPHIVPFFFNSKGGVGKPSRWSSGEQEASWRGGFLLAALELYLKNDMKAKFVFLNDLEAALGFTSTMMTQQFHGSTTIVPQVRLADYFRLFADPDAPYIKECMKIGAVAAYHHAAMIRSHYTIADTIEECLEKLGVPSNNTTTANNKRQPSRRASFDVKKQISEAMANVRRPFNPETMPEIISAALKERLTESDSTDMSDGSYF